MPDVYKRQDTKNGNNPIAPGYRIMRGDVDVTRRYKITENPGTLTIKPKEVRITVCLLYTSLYQGCLMLINWAGNTVQQGFLLEYLKILLCKLNQHGIPRFLREKNSSRSMVLLYHRKRGKCNNEREKISL